MKIAIKNWITGSLIFECDADSLKIGLEIAVGKKTNLEGANLAGANLAGAYLAGAYLAGANLAGANLARANLAGAYLAGANLAGANLAGANLEPIRNDLWAVLSSAPAEAEAVLSALKEGRVDGSCYEGECACLVGTIANARHCKYSELKSLEPDSDRPAERFFMGIKKGDTPQNNPVSKIAAEWIEEWVGNIKGAFSAAQEPPK